MSTFGYLRAHAMRIRFPFSLRAMRWVLGLMAAASWLSLGWVWWLGREPESRATTLNGIMKKVGSVLHGFSPDGQTLITSDTSSGTVTFWDVNTGQKRAELKGHQQTARSVAFAGDGKTIATSSDDGTIKIWDANTYQFLTGFESQQGNVNLVTYAPDSKMLASVGSDGSVKIWEVATGKARTAPLSAFSLKFAPDGKMLAAIKRNAVTLWDVTTGEERRTFIMPPVWQAAFSPNGRTLATSHMNGTVMLWDLATGESQVVFAAPEASVLAFSPDGKTLVASFLYHSPGAVQFRGWLDIPGLGRLTNGSETVLIDVTDGRKPVHLPGCLYGTFFPNGKVLATWQVQQDRVELWDIPPHTVLHPVFTWITLGFALTVSIAWWYSGRMHSSPSISVVSSTEKR